MPVKQKWNIPTDYDEENTDWVICMMCVPNTQGWRGVVSGAIYNLTRGRNWHRDTGIITDAQDIGVRIYDSMAIDCSGVWERIATAQESIDEKTPDLITLSEFLADLDNSTLGDIADWLTIGGVIGDMLPSISIRLSPVDWIRMIMEILWKRRMAKAAEDIAFQLKVNNFVEGGETVAEGVEAIDGVIDDISDWASILVQGLGATAAGVEAYAELRDQFSEAGADEDLELRNINRVYNEVFVEGDGVTQINNNNQTVNCCGGAGCEFPSESPTDGENDLPDYDIDDSPEDYPIGFEDADEWAEYRCKASHAMVYNIAESLYQVYLTANNQFEETTRTGMIIAYVTARKAAAADPFVGWLYSEEYVTSWLQWEAELVIDWIWGETDYSPFDIFADIRLDVLSDVETPACEIYQGDSTDEIKTTLMSFFNDLLGDSGYTTAEQSWAYNVIELMLSNAWLGIPFKKYINVDDSTITPTPDCTYCGTCRPIEAQVSAGSFDGDDTFTSVLNTSTTPDRHHTKMEFMHTAEDEKCGSVRINSITVNYGAPDSLSNFAYRFFNESNTQIYSSETPPTNLAGVSWGEIMDQTSPQNEFEVTIDWTVE